MIKREWFWKLFCRTFASLEPSNGKFIQKDTAHLQVESFQGQVGCREVDVTRGFSLWGVWARTEGKVGKQGDKTAGYLSSNTFRQSELHWRGYGICCDHQGNSVAWGKSFICCQEIVRVHYKMFGDVATGYMVNGIWIAERVWARFFLLWVFQLLFYFNLKRTSPEL